LASKRRLDPTTYLRSIRHFMLDLDGVVYRGDQPIPDARLAINALERDGKKILYLTNNSTLSRGQYAKKLRSFGIVAEPEQIVTSGFATARLLQSRRRKLRIFAIGEEGLAEELRLAGLTLIDEESPERADAVVVGLDRGFNYRKLAQAMRAVREGAEFIATNPDTTLPTPGGLSPGVGAILSAIEACSERAPSVVVGKPNGYIVEVALEISGASRDSTAVVGDRLDTDIVAGNRCGLFTILVLTGVTKRSELTKMRTDLESPDLVVENLSELVRKVSALH
jgi:4-nitrophenyl phosphatase